MIAQVGSRAACLFGGLCAQQQQVTINSRADGHRLTNSRGQRAEGRCGLRYCAKGAIRIPIARLRCYSDCSRIGRRSSGSVMETPRQGKSAVYPHSAGALLLPGIAAPTDRLSPRRVMLQLQDVNPGGAPGPGPRRHLAPRRRGMAHDDSAQVPGFLLGKVPAVPAAFAPCPSARPPVANKHYSRSGLLRPAGTR